MNQHMSLRTWIERFNRGDFEYADRDVQIEAGWHDWFCETDKLAIKTKNLGKIVCRLANSPKLDVDKHYVWFTNNKPVLGTLYDTIRFSSLADGKPIYVIAPRVGHKHCDPGKRSEVSWVSEDKHDEVQGTMRDVYAYFGV